MPQGDTSGAGSSPIGLLVRGSVGGVVVQVFAAVFVFLQTVLLARMLGSEKLGVFVFAMAILSLLVVPSTFGLPTLVVRETAKAVAGEDWGLVKGVWAWANRVSLLIGVTLMAGILAFSWLWSDRDPELAKAFAWGALLIPLLPMARLRGASLRGLRHVVAGQLPERIFRTGSFVLILAAFWLLAPDEMTPSLAMFLASVAGLVGLVGGSVLLRRAIPPQVRGATSASTSAFWLKATLPLALSGGMFFVNQYTDVLMLGVVVGKEEVGIYRVAAQIALLIAFGLNAVNLAVAPMFARLHEQGKRAELSRLVTMASRAVLLFTVPATIVFFLFGDVFLRTFFGTGFVSAFTPAAILIVGQLVNSLTGSVAMLLNMTGFERHVSLGVAISSVGNIALNAALIPLFEMTGAAIATAVSMGVWNLVLWSMTRSRLGINSLAFTPATIGGGA